MVYVPVLRVVQRGLDSRDDRKYDQEVSVNDHIETNLACALELYNAQPVLAGHAEAAQG